MKNESKYFYCYSSKLRRYLTENGITWSDKGMNETSGHRYWMFTRNDKFESIIKEYNK